MSRIRYDTVDWRALKSWRDGQLSLAHGPETKKYGKNQIKYQVAQKKRSRQRSVEAVREEEVKLRGVGFVKKAGFKREWKRDGVIDVQSGESDEEDVVGGGICEKEMEELVLE